MEMIRDNIRSAVVPRGLIAGPFMGEDETGDSGRDSDILELHCTSSGIDSERGRGDIRNVQLLCEPDENGNGMKLIRRIRLNPLASTNVEPVDEVICRGVYSFNLRYFDGLDWLDYWDSTTQEDELPSAVEVTLQLMRREDRRKDHLQEDPLEVAGYLTSRVFLIPCSTIVPESGGEMGMDMDMGLSGPGR